MLRRGKSWVRLVSNTKKTHPRAVHRKESGKVCRSMHAEHSALLWARPGDVLYVARFSALGEERNSLPCPECQAKLSAAGLKKVYYTNAEGQWTRLYL